MADSIEIWVAGAIILAFFIGLFMRYLFDYLDYRMKRTPPRYEQPKGD